MYQLTEKGRRIADALDKDPDKEYLFSHISDWDLGPSQQVCLNWLRGNLGPRLMEVAIGAQMVDPYIPRALGQLIEKGFVEIVK